jgi:hypothetical protein
LLRDRVARPGDGFATTFEILQTYTPVASQLGFRVPYIPEGFQYAAWVDIQNTGGPDDKTPVTTPFLAV